ncbi:MAG TPA: hypothetical protein PLW88_00195 [Syntrophorhabdaceae bacterium]|nr:hypothetical protein [Syntrophorhabdaceae bacterium]HPP05759.1 hypothetical protein [Syntrophorhabdaceae bacterium]
MTDMDEWGKDPQVRFLRQAFSLIEKSQGSFLDKIGISIFDERLRRIRDGALTVFERAWGLAARKRMALDEKDMEHLYMFSLAYVLKRYNITVPDELLPSDDNAKKLVSEVTR